MVDLSPTRPVGIEEAVHSISDNGLMTLAAFLLAAGVLYQKLHQRLPSDQVQAILPNDDMEELGLSGWSPVDVEASRQISFDPERFPDSEVGISNPIEKHARLAQLIWEAFKSRNSLDLANAVAMGTGNPDPLVRVCALTSAFEMFSVSRDLVRRLVEFDYSGESSATTLQSMLLSKLFAFAYSAVGVPPAVTQTSPSKTAGLILIHGTNFPPNRPVWSVPGKGPLFQYIAGYRSDLYAKPDYFRWEGGYSDYAREVAAMNLDDWIQRRRMTGIDAVTHSHGGNVLMSSTYLSIKFGKVVLLSCPVRWAQYQVCPGTITKVDSVRVKYDLVIVADRAGQRFPIGSGIKDTVLPIWYNHSATTEPITWKRYKLDSFL